jgi:hypothetical protein
MLEVDRDVERRTRCAHEPVVLGLRGVRERGGEAALAPLAEAERPDVAQQLGDG